MTSIATFKLTFLTKNPLILPQFSGTIALSVFLEVLSRADPELARELHEYRGRKPYAVSPFNWRDKFYGFRLVPSGEEVWFRAAVIGDVTRKFLSGLIDSLPTDFRLGNTELELQDVQVDVKSMEEVSGFKAEAVRVDFLTPVRFSVAGTKKRRTPKFRLFPTPEHVFHSLADHWNEHAPRGLKVPHRFPEWVINYAVEVDYRLKPITLEGTGNRVFRGSVGYVIYRFNDLSMSAWATRLLEYGQLVNVGTGRSTGLGVMKYREA